MKQQPEWWRKWRTLGKGDASEESASALPPPPYRLNLGCGARIHPAWINVDVTPQSPAVHPHDLRDPLPFPDGSCTAVYASHVLEHFARADAPRFLRECRRVLMSGGVLRIVVPDLETIARLYLTNLEGALAGDAAAAHRYDWIVLELLDQLVREQSGGEMLNYWRQNPMPAESFVIERVGQEVHEVLRQLRSKVASAPVPSGAKPDPLAVAKFRSGGEVHKWMYDRFSLGRLLHECGFDRVRACQADESAIPEFDTYRLDLDDTGRPRKPDSLFMEAARP
jgi:predicted SAM-dependent methyltransferase